ncbi:hypothetical protein HY256_00060 [Candidatus Sumerlaeota bacterium]|nr:hypothetical protein [Candidatus Sumerlaeota bacterium]
MEPAWETEPLWKLDRKGIAVRRLARISFYGFAAGIILCSGALFAAGRGKGHDKQKEKDKDPKPDPPQAREHQPKGNQMEEIQRKLDKIAENPPEGWDNGKKEGWEGGNLPPGREKKAEKSGDLGFKNDRVLHHHPRDWDKWDELRRTKWESEMEKARINLRERAGTQKNLSEEDMTRAMGALDRLSARGIAPMEASGAVDQALQRGLRGDRFGSAMNSFDRNLGGETTASRSFQPGELGDILRRSIEEVLGGKPATVDVGRDGVVIPPSGGVPKAQSDTPIVSAPPVTAPSAAAALKDNQPQKAAKHGKIH